MGILNRCVFIEGVGRCHVLGDPDNPHVGVMDGSPMSFILANRALDVVTGKSPGRILWAVRFKEK